MPDTFDPETEPPQGWRVAETRENGAIFRYDETGCELLVLQVKGPGRSHGEHSESYVLRYFEDGDRSSYIDVATVQSRPEMQEITREVMGEITKGKTDSQRRHRCDMK